MVEEKHTFFFSSSSMEFAQIDTDVKLTIGDHPKKPGKLVGIISKKFPNNDIEVLSVAVRPSAHELHWWFQVSIRTRPWDYKVPFRIKLTLV